MNGTANWKAGKARTLDVSEEAQGTRSVKRRESQPIALKSVQFGVAVHAPPGSFSGLGGPKALVGFRGSFSGYAAGRHGVT